LKFFFKPSAIKEQLSNEDIGHPISLQLRFTFFEMRNVFEENDIFLFKHYRSIFDFFENILSSSEDNVSDAIKKSLFECKRKALFQVYLFYIIAILIISISDGHLQIEEVL
jgi:hypothetical protein